MKLKNGSLSEVLAFSLKQNAWLAARARNSKKAAFRQTGKSAFAKRMWSSKQG
jgi:hypothetical protein